MQPQTCVVLSVSSVGNHYKFKCLLAFQLVVKLIYFKNHLISLIVFNNMLFRRIIMFLAVLQWRKNITTVISKWISNANFYKSYKHVYFYNLHNFQHSPDVLKNIHSTIPHLIEFHLEIIKCKFYNTIHAYMNTHTHTHTYV